MSLARLLLCLLYFQSPFSIPSAPVQHTVIGLTLQSYSQGPLTTCSKASVKRSAQPTYAFHRLLQAWSEVLIFICVFGSPNVCQSTFRRQFGYLKLFFFLTVLFCGLKLTSDLLSICFLIQVLGLLACATIPNTSVLVFPRNLPFVGSSGP